MAKRSRQRGGRGQPGGSKSGPAPPSPREAAVTAPGKVTEPPLEQAAARPAELTQPSSDDAPAPARALGPALDPAPAAQSTSLPDGPAAREWRPSPGGLTSFYLHLHPRLVRRRSTGLGATLGLGFATLVALGLATLSGFLLMVHYVPSVEQAHASVQDLVSLVPFGRFLRNLHRWAGHAAVLFAFLHLLRTWLWGSHQGAHARVWLLGCLLLLVTAATGYSGYLLPWDQDAYWTVTVGTSLVGYVPLVGEALQRALLGGDSVAQSALTRFYFMHVALLPALGLLLLLLHLFRLRRAGGLARPPGASGSGEELVAASPALTSRELALTLFLTLLLCALALGVDARLGPAADTLRPDDPPKAPWFLVGLQETVSYSATVGGVLFPGLLLLLLILLPWLAGSAEGQGSPLRSRGGRLTLASAALLGGLATALSVRWWGDPQAGEPSALNPASVAALAALACASLAALIWRRRDLAVHSLLGCLLAALLVFTAVGWFWRGPDWKLTWHPGPGRPAPAELRLTGKARGPAGAVPVEVRSADGSVDRCPTCHSAMLGSAGQRSSHPRVPGHPDPAALGCTACHGGQGRRLDLEAHQPGLGGGPRPFLRRPYLEARCARCHLPGVEGAPALARGIEEYLDAGCSGCHQPGRLDQGLGPDLRRLGRRSRDELLRALLDPEQAHPGSVMWSLRWRYDEKTAPGKRALDDLVTALLALGESPRPFQDGWARPQVRSDLDCAACHFSTANGPRAGSPRHRCGYLRDNPGLRCPACHQGPGRLPAGSSGACPQLAAARPSCAVCHGGRDSAESSPVRMRRPAPSGPR